MILVPAFTLPPMRCPDDVWAMLVTAVDIISDADPDRSDEVALFAGSWLPKQPPADGLYDGDLVVRLTHPADPTYPPPRDHAADVEMQLAYQGCWQRVGQWRGLDDSWPTLVAPTAAAVMGRHGDATQATIWSETPPPPTLPPPIKWARSGIAELLDAELVMAGEELVWNRPNSASGTPPASGPMAPSSSPTAGFTPTRPVPPQHWAATTRTAGTPFAVYPTGARWATSARNSARGAGSNPPLAIRYWSTSDPLCGGQIAR